ncbi:class I SAM-dependent methyltransferase [Nonomuraea sp. NBC_01738]|uniref:class I SAM-dependent methyltransferase n=1 Tax=Nonomuraea sp. NBC_01738 TaxID=2976003 RepID=UPI002E15A143|nr:class I SAM-dependent methyltransferase [Nonomuraea sp. NBC_01738]
MDAEELSSLWRERLGSWAIPERILKQAPADPWGHNPTRFATRTDRALADPDRGPTMTRLAEALPEGGSLLDVGAGTGASSLPLRDRVGELFAVDSSAAMLDELVLKADKLGVSVTRVKGRWPDAATDVPVCDVAIAAHVIYNVPDAREFLAALDAHTRRRVVLELTHRHPMSWLEPLWEHFHGVSRPVRPIAEDVVALAAAMGYGVRVEEREAPLERFSTLEELAASACHRICLDPARAEEVGNTAMELGMWPVPRDRWVTIWWDHRE